MPSPQAALKQHFGFDNFREGQEETIRRALNGQHSLLVMPTGSGKSLTYQLPALLLPGLTLVISPLIALMKDQVDSLTGAGLPATYINSSLPADEANRRARAMLEGHVKLLYIAPERLRHRAFTRALANTKISLLAVDEAHCISQWGHDFRPDYLHIGPTWQAMGRPTLLATTATATPKVQKDILQLLGLENAHTIVTGFNRPNLSFRVLFAPDERAKLQGLQNHLQKLENSAIVYCATRRATEEVANFISNALGLPARAYHAGLDRQLRYRVQTDFMANRFKIVVATNAFGMGVDKPDVRAVLHYNMPATVEAYYQEAGRAGRDGQPAECVLLYAPDDQRLQEWFINSDTPSHDDLHQLYTRLAGAASQGEVYFSSREMAEMTGLHQVKIRVALSELEQAGVIIHLGDDGGYGRWKVLPLSSEALRQRASIIQQRAKNQLELLDAMLSYVRLTSCRRQFLLRYFGDSSPPRSARCCDNHGSDIVEELPKAVTPQEWLPLVVLETVRTFQGRPIGRSRLAQLLGGSQAKPMQRFGYDRHKFYGKLNALSQAQITALVDALISARYLQLTGSNLPVLTLTETGFKALEARAALPITAPRLPAPADTPSPAPVPSLPGTPASELTPADIILNAVARLGGTLGRTGLAQFLSGSKAAWLETFVQHSAYGQLAGMSQKAILNIIDALITDGRLLTTGGNRPKVALPDAPRAARSAPAQTLNAADAIVAAVSDLDGLLTIEGLAQLLTAGPHEVVSFSDHELFGAFHGRLSRDDVLAQINEALQQKQLLLSPRQRLTLP